MYEFLCQVNLRKFSVLYNPDVFSCVFLSQASQKVNTHQFATTTITISVQVESLHPPKFQKDHYEGVISSVGAVAMDLTNKDTPLQIIATDEDYAATAVKCSYSNP